MVPLIIFRDISKIPQGSDKPCGILLISEGVFPLELIQFVDFINSIDDLS